VDVGVRFLGVAPALPAAAARALDDPGAARSPSHDDGGNLTNGWWAA